MINTEVKQERTDSHPLDGDAGVVSKSVTPLTRVFPSPAGPEMVENLTFLLQDQQVTKPAYLFKQPSVLFCSSLRWDQGFKVKLGFLWLFFVLDSSQGASHSHVANAVFVTSAPTLLPPGNTRRGQSCAFFALSKNIRALGCFYFGCACTQNSVECNIFMVAAVIPRFSFFHWVHLNDVPVHPNEIKLEKCIWSPEYVVLATQFTQCRNSKTLSYKTASLADIVVACIWN